MGCSLPGSSVHGIFQAIVLEWIAISFSRGSSQPSDLNPRLPHCRETLYHQSHQGSQWWKLMNERPKKRMFFRHLSISNSLDSKMWELQVCTEALISKVTSSMFPCISEPCEPIPRSSWDCPWGNRLCLRVLSASSFVTKGVYIPLEMIQRQGIAATQRNAASTIRFQILC